MSQAACEIWAQTATPEYLDLVNRGVVSPDLWWGLQHNWAVPILALVGFILVRAAFVSGVGALAPGMKRGPRIRFLLFLIAVTLVSLKFPVASLVLTVVSWWYVPVSLVVITVAFFTKPFFNRKTKARAAADLLRARNIDEIRKGAANIRILAAKRGWNVDAEIQNILDDDCLRGSEDDEYEDDNSLAGLLARRVPGGWIILLTLYGLMIFTIMHFGQIADHKAEEQRAQQLQMRTPPPQARAHLQMTRLLCSDVPVNPTAEAWAKIDAQEKRQWQTQPHQPRTIIANPAPESAPEQMTEN